MTFVGMEWDPDLAERARINADEFEAESLRVAKDPTAILFNGKLQMLVDESCEIHQEQIARDNRRFFIRWGLFSVLCGVLYVALTVYL